MRGRLVITIMGALIGLGTLAVQAQQQFQVFARIVDSSGKPVAALEPADVRVMENGTEGKIMKVEPVNWPIKVQLLVDNGIGLGGDNLSHIRNGVRGFIEALPEGTELALVTTAPQPRFIVRPTTDRMAQLKGIDLLSPDSGAGRFTESLSEALQRIEKDKGDYFPVIVCAGTMAGDTNNLESTVQKLMKRLEEHPTTVHVVLFSKGTASSSGGQVQTQVGMAVTQFVRGRFESINAPTRLATLLPEIGAQVAKSHENQSHQFRLTIARPGGASGNIGQITMSTKGGLSATSLSMDGRVP
jgi:hypothetical protein